MLPRRGYEPVDSVEENVTRGEFTNESGDGRRLGYASITAVGPSKANAEPRGGQDDGSTSSASNGLDDDSEGTMTVRVLDVQGQTYTLRVRPETRVSELKTRLVEIAGVEIARQRIIWSGKILGDSDTLSSRKITDGAAMHLFQRPKNALALSGIGTAEAQPPSGLHDIPPVLLQLRQQRLRGQGLLDDHWEIDVPRRVLRFLASLLLMISIMQFLECLSRYSVAMASSGSEKGDYAQSALDEYWNLVRSRSVSSVLGIAVGLLGVRASHNLSAQTIRLYLAGLVMCAVITVSIQIEYIFDLVTGKIPLQGFLHEDDRDGNESSYSDRSSDGDDRDGDGGGGQGYTSSPMAEERSMYFRVFTAFLGLIVSVVVWLSCIRRVNSLRVEIATYMHSRERQMAEMREELDRQRATTARLEEGTASVTHSIMP